MATDAFSGLRSKYARSKRGDTRLDALDEEARKSVVVTLTSDEKFLQDALKESKTEDAPRIRTLVKATINSALKALYDGADAAKLRQINPNHDFDVPAYEPQTMRESLMKRVVEASVAAKVEEELHPRSQLLAWANREGEALTRKVLATETGKVQEAAAAQQDAERAAAARRALVESTLKSQSNLFEDEKERDAFEGFSASLDKGSVNDRFNALRDLNTPARRDERARLQKEASDAYKELMSLPGVDASKIKQPTTKSNNFFAKVFAVPTEHIAAAKQ